MVYYFVYGWQIIERYFFNFWIIIYCIKYLLGVNYDLEL
jgi:hypothetical protein